MTDVTDIVPNNGSAVILQDRALTTGEVAIACSVSTRTVYNWCNLGLIKYYRLPGGNTHRRILQSNLLEFSIKYELPLQLGQIKKRKPRGRASTKEVKP